MPPDGRFILAGYEVNLLPSDDILSKSNANLKLPVSLEVKTNLGPTGSDFEVRLLLSPPLPANSLSSSSQSSRTPGRSMGGGASGPGFGAGGSTPKSNIEGLKLTIPIPSSVRNLTEIRASRGDPTYAPGATALEWNIPLKEAGAGTATLRATCVGNLDDEEEEESANNFSFDTYDETEGYQTSVSASPKKAELDKEGQNGERDVRRVARNKLLMPSSARVSFGIKGWLASGLRVESLGIDQRKSRGVEGGMKLFKGVKYLTASTGGVEVRC